MKELVLKLKDMQIFDKINVMDLTTMLQCLGSYSKDYKKSEFIFLDGGELDNIGVIISGTVQMVKEDIWGTKSILAMMREGSIFGETFVCGNLDSSIVSFQAATDCKILFLSFRRVLRSCNMSCVFHHKLIENMVALIAQKNVQLVEKMEIISKNTIRKRILTYLSQQIQKNGKQYFISPMGRVELADYLCVDRSALTRELVRMKEDGLLDYDKNTFYLK